MHSSRFGYGILLASLLLVGCGAANTPPRSANDPTAGPERIELPRTVITPGEEANIPELYAAARRTLDSGDAKRAAQELDRIYRLDPDGELAPDTLYLSALAHEQSGDREAALARFEQLASRHPKHPLAREALLRAIRLACFLERWQRAGQASRLFLQRYPDPRPLEQIVALSGQSLAQIASGDLEGATFNAEKARGVIEREGLDRAGTIPRDLAQTYFALGEIRRIKAEQIRFVPVPPNFPAVLEQRCQLLLDAQRAYSDTMRAYDAHWSAMAGYRVGELYQKLHEDVMQVPFPESADTEARKQLFEGAIRLRYSVLLDKAHSMMEHTLSMASRTGERSSWVVRAEDALRQIDKARRAENAAIDRLPYTRAQLSAALEDLRKKGAKTP